MIDSRSNCSILYHSSRNVVVLMIYKWFQERERETETEIETERQRDRQRQRQREI